MFNWLRWLLRRPRKGKKTPTIDVAKPPEEEPVKKERPLIGARKILASKTKEPKEEKVKLYPARNLVLLTSEANMRLTTCKVNDDHTLDFEKKKNVRVKADRPAHILELPLQKIWPTFLGRLLSPRRQRYNVYTIKEVGEMTHDPNLDHLDAAMKLSFEKMLKMEGKFAEVNAGGVVYEGLKGKKAWWDYIPYLVILGVVFLFLFAMTQGVSG